jgi:sugar phosphate isomerase/epimerase
VISRRRWLAAAAALPLSARKAPGLQIGTMDGVLRLSGKPEAVALARSIGFDALQVTLGRAGPDGKLPLEDAAVQARYRDEAGRLGLPIGAAYLDILHAHCLKDDRQAKEWVRRGVAATRALGARILMTVFFGKCALADRAEMDAAAGAFRELAPEAARAGVVLGFENLLEARDNLRVLDQVASDAFRIWYDVGNATSLVGADAATEIRDLGRDRICALHFKDRGYLGEGKVDFPSVLAALDDIGYRGCAYLETSAPSGRVQDDVRRNLDYLRRLMA